MQGLTVAIRLIKQCAYVYGKEDSSWVQLLLLDAYEKA